TVWQRRGCNKVSRPRKSGPVRLLDRAICGTPSWFTIIFRGSSMPKVDTSIGKLVEMIQSGELRLPEMQRRYVWPATRVRDLLDSLYRGYPSGTILVWETDREMPSRDLAVIQGQSSFTGHKLLLDGQQRLTSLSAVLRGEP